MSNIKAILERSEAILAGTHVPSRRRHRDLSSHTTAKSISAPNFLTGSIVMASGSRVIW